jgi:hypothetical protein
MYNLRKRATRRRINMDKDTLYAVQRLAEAVEYRDAMDRIKEGAYAAWKNAEKKSKGGWTQYYNRRHELERR